MAEVIETLEDAIPTLDRIMELYTFQLFGPYVWVDKAFEPTNEPAFDLEKESFTS